MFPQLLHVRPDKHLPEFDKIAMFFLVDFDDSPWIGSTSGHAIIGGSDDIVRTDYGKGDLALRRLSAIGEISGYTYSDFLVLLDGFLIFIFVCGRLEDTDAMVVNIGKDLHHMSMLYSAL
jgi:hypothetical protein